MAAITRTPFGDSDDFQNAPIQDPPAAGMKPSGFGMFDSDRMDAVSRALFDAAQRFDQLVRFDDATGFIESEHPRDEEGKFSESGSAGGSSGDATRRMEKTKTVDGKRMQESGAALPQHVEKLKIPPAWTDVEYSSDPDASLLAIGKDSKGRRQAIYSAKFAATNAAAKFARIKALSEKMPEIERQVGDDRKSDNPKERDNADCAALIMKMGVRPGSEDDTGAKVKAYGATTLEGKHVVKGQDGKVHLKFVGKKGVSLDLPVDDDALAHDLLDRAKKAGADGKLFGSVTDKSLLDYVHTLDGGSFKTKDFRTNLATTTAYRLVGARDVPRSEKEYKKAILEVARLVSSKLGNTPTVALQSYIAPEVFAPWRMAA